MKRTSKQQQENNYDIEAYRKKQKRKKWLHRFLRLLIVVLLLGGTFAGIWLYDKYDLGQFLNQPHGSDAQTQQDTVVQNGGFPVSLDGSQPLGLTKFGENILLLTKDETLITGESGKFTSQYVHGYTNPVVRSGESKYLIYDRGGYGYRWQSSHGTVARGRTTQTIMTGACGKNHYFALVTSEDRYAAAVTVYNKNGQPVLNWYSPEPVADLAFSPDDKELAVITVVFDTGGQLNSRVRLFDLHKEAETASVDFEDSLPVAVNILEDGTIHVVTDSYLGVLSQDLKTKKTISYMQPLQQYRFSAEQTLLVTSSANEVSSTITLVSSAGDIKEKTIRNAVGDISLDGSRFCVLAGSIITLYSSEMEPLWVASVSNDVFRILYHQNALYTISTSVLDQIENAEEGTAD